MIVACLFCLVCCLLLFCWFLCNLVCYLLIGLLCSCVILFCLAVVFSCCLLDFGVVLFCSRFDCFVTFCILDNLCGIVFALDSC